MSAARPFTVEEARECIKQAVTWCGTHDQPWYQCRLKASQSRIDELERENATLKRSLNSTVDGEFR